MRSFCVGAALAPLVGRIVGLAEGLAVEVYTIDRPMNSVYAISSSATGELGDWTGLHVLTGIA